MKDLELRIGNLVTSDKENAPTPFAINRKRMQYLCKHADWHLLEPIPLTEEWKEKLGFEGDEIVCGEYIMQVVVNMFSGTLEKEPSWFISIIHDSGNQKITVVKQHVHQLQNFYFALTGKELEIKL